ncbi:MAG: hypothetical protein RL268_2558 [Pseudomonadota bacterium]|jgi:Ca2+-binding EF-hand superfamily protein
MKKTVLAIALLTTGLAGGAYAQTPARGGDPMGDKTVTKAEAQAKAAEMFAKMDVNKDGKLDQADRGAHRAQMFDRLDANKDGNVSRDEFAAAHQRKAGDAKPAGERKMGEHRMGKRGGGHMGGGRMMMQMADTNKDGAISRDEIAAAHARMFDMADANKDGQLTAAERKAHHDQMRQKMGDKAGDHAGHAGHQTNK